MGAITGLIILLWLFCGYIGWRLRYYGLMKTWYEKYGYKKNLAEESQANHWSYGFPILLVGGIVTIILVLQEEEDVAWYFKQPKR